MFINEDNEQISDKRFKRVQVMEEIKGKVNKRWDYKFYSQFDLPEEYQLATSQEADTSIFNCAYSNKTGVLFYNCQKGLCVYRLSDLEPIIRLNKVGLPTVISKDNGLLFLS